MNRVYVGSKKFVLIALIGLTAPALGGCVAETGDEPSPTDPPAVSPESDHGRTEESVPTPGNVGDSRPSSFAALGERFIAPHKSLMITDPAITDHATRTLDPCIERDVKRVAAGPVKSTQTWTFGHLMTQMANGQDPGVFAHNWLANWAISTSVNGDRLVATRFGDGSIPSLPIRIYDAWQRASGGTPGGSVALKMNRAPFRLLAIVNRFDLRKNRRFGEGNAGELRFVFSILDLDQKEPTGGCLQSSARTSSSLPGDNLLILEYAVDRADSAAIASWISSWADLSNSATFDSPDDARLEALTQQVVRAGAGGSRPNGSALIRLRTNETEDGIHWDLREFAIDPTARFLIPVTTKQTPKVGLERDDSLIAWINSQGTQILNDTYVLPTQFVGAHARNSPSITWFLPGVSDSRVRHAFALGTCNGCHQLESGNLTDQNSGRAGFSHVSGRVLGGTSTLSSFLTGVDSNGVTFCPLDPVTGEELPCFYELRKRADDMNSYFVNGQ